jgi:hypoxanthine phosphoribosyltransferase
MRTRSGFTIPEEEIRARVKVLAREISRDYEGEALLLVGILKGSFVFLADLVRELTIDVELDFLSVSSYGRSTQSTGVVKIVKDLSEAIQGRHVVLVEDIVDSGLTLKYLYDFLEEKDPASLAICALLDKTEARRVEVPLKYVGFRVPDEFLVGYGLDFAERFRHLRYVRALGPDEVKEYGEREEA